MPSSSSSFRSNQRGGVTILVVLMLLVLLTVASVAMSKNALRQAVLSGTARQGAEARSIADSGVEWAILWLDDANAATPDAAAQLLRAKATEISDTADLAGKAQALGTTGSMVLDPTPALTKRFNLELMYMGTVDPGATSSNAQTSPGLVSVTDLACWSVRSEGQLAYANGPTFIHRREVWFTALPKVH